MITLRDFLAKGYFPEVLPPPFKTNSYGDACSDLKLLPKEFLFNQNRKKCHRYTSKCSIYNQARQGFLRRKWSIPNPVHYFRLAHCIAKNWAIIEKKATASPISLTKPAISLSLRATKPQVPFKDRPVHRARIRALSKYIVKADVSQCFPSIYTHSIGWAFHGKNFCKRKKSLQLLGNEIDKHYQNLQDGQTSGITIGQDISRIIAEIILSSVDNNLAKSGSINGIRCIDDYEFGVLSLAEAESILNKLQQELDKYELTLNPQKTQISTLPSYLIDRWDSELRNFNFGIHEEDFELEEDSGTVVDSYSKVSREKLLLFFNKAFELQKNYTNHGVLRFSIHRLSTLRISENDWGFYQDYLIQCAMIETGTIQHVIKNLLKAKYIEKHTVDKGLLQKLFNFVIIDNAKLGHSSEVAWSIWGSLLFGTLITEEATKNIERMLDPVVVLLALDAEEKGLMQKTLDKTQFLKLVSLDDLYGDYWLLSYEGSVQDWLKNGKKHVKNDKCFSYLFEQRVNFYDTEADQEMIRWYEEIAGSDDNIATDDDEDDEVDSDAEDEFDLWWLQKDD